MQHHATADFWKEYGALPQEIRNRADRKFALLKAKSFLAIQEARRAPRSGDLVGARHGELSRPRNQTDGRIPLVLDW
jgi:hypothetical protein